MKFFSKKGEKGTFFEKGIFVVVLLGAGTFFFSTFKETAEHRMIFAKASAALQERCALDSNYVSWKIWDTQAAAYHNCIVKAQDPEVQHAAGEYLLKGATGEIKVRQDAPELKSNP